MISKVIKYQIDNELTQSELCDQIGLSIKSLYNARRGDISENTIKKISSFCEEKKL